MRGLIDSGTTRTRLRVVSGERVLWAGECTVGARDVAASGGPQVLTQAIEGLLARARVTVRVDELVCSGMITSNVGLAEVPHLTAPAGAAELAGAVQQLDVAGFGVPCFLIPGVRTLPADLSWDTLAETDVLRGEEVEVLGLRELLELGEASFLHLGSHPKRVELDAAGRLTGSRTALSGELSAALAEYTVLSGSVLPVERWETVSPLFWQRGLEAARQHGLGRALFMVRLGQLLLHASREELSAYLLGAVSAETLRLLSPAAARPLVIYGPETLARLLAPEAGALGWARVQVVTAEQTSQATVLGAQAVMRARAQQLADQQEERRA